jgi:CheY-like chemotaxis protein
MVPKAVPDAEAALAAIADAHGKGEDFEIIVIDHMMPGFDGIELAKRIRAEPAYGAVKLVLCSSAGLITSSKRAAELGFDALLHKPVRQTAFMEALAGFWSGRSASPSIASSPERVATSWAAAAARILIVEDSVINQKVARALAEKAGYRCEVAANGIEALAAIRERPYDLVLMDVQMPEMDGYTATRRVRGLAGEIARTPIVGMTANAMKGDREKCLEAGMDDYISKPINTQEFLQKISQWVAVAKIRRGKVAQ